MLIPTADTIISTPVPTGCCYGLMDVRSHLPLAFLIALTFQLSPSPTPLAYAEDISPCPRGMYRATGAGYRQGECLWCPRGRYGSSQGLTSSACTAKCPTGRYNDRLGARTVDDCKFCMAGRYGSQEGLTTKDCSGWCPAGKYSNVVGITTNNDCVDCPPGYRGWQCNAPHWGGDEIYRWKQTVRRDFWSSTDGAVTEASHAYVDGRYIPQHGSDVTFDKVTTPLENTQSASTSRLGLD